MVNPQRLPRDPYIGERLGIVLGMLLGDGSIAKKYKNRLTLTCDIENIDYLRWKISILEKLGFNGLKIRNIRSSITGYENSKGGHIVDICGEDKKIEWMYRNFYHNGKRYLNNNLFRHINKYGLAIWFMDDGLIVKRGYDYYSISTAAFSLEENKRIIKIIKKRFGLSATIQRDKRYYKIYFGGKEGRNFINLIRPYIHPSMRYKLCQTLDNTNEDIVRSL